MCVRRRDIVVGECSFASRRTSWWQADVPASYSRAAGRRKSVATVRNSKARERFDHSGEQRGHTSSGSHLRAHYNVEQPTRNAETREEKEHPIIQSTMKSII